MLPDMKTLNKISSHKTKFKLEKINTHVCKEKIILPKDSPTVTSCRGKATDSAKEL